MTPAELANQFESVIEALRDLADEDGIPKNIRESIGSTIQVLEEPAENSIKVSKALQLLEEVADDVNVDSFARVQLLNVVSMLEVI